MEKIFYTPELTQILNKLIPDIPMVGSFDLYEISKKSDISLDDFFADGLAKVEETYLQIANQLIVNDLAVLRQGHKIELNENGKELVKHKTWERFAEFIKLKEKAEINDLWKKAFWVRHELIKTLIIVFITIGLTLVTKWLLGESP